MNKATENLDAWHPQTADERNAILHELQEVIASPHFCNSRRYPALLRYIVENTLAGKSETLKERTLGIEVFDRPPTYDTNADTVVRYTAGEVRKRLSLYYMEHGHSSGIRISLPAGSYIPEFQPENEEVAETVESKRSFETQPSNGKVSGVAVRNGAEHEPDSAADVAPQLPGLVSPHKTIPTAAQESSHRTNKYRMWAVLVVLVLGVIAAGIALRYRALASQEAIEEFWAPVVHDQRTVAICTGGVVFQQNNFSGVITAGKDSEYPFVSMQIASAIAQLSALLEHSGTTAQLLSSPSTPLTELREHPVILLGGYNNQWAIRLLQAQRFQFTPEPTESIIDRTQPQVHWSRDRSLPYSAADDYALVARFRDTTTGSWVVVLAGLGRNGTEAATQFVTSPHYLQMLQDQMGQRFSNRNIEVVLKLRVVDGKTGAPSILATHMW
jgi:hypothetical protein